jgi:hypothetical protein
MDRTHHIDSPMRLTSLERARAMSERAELHLADARRAETQQAMTAALDRAEKQINAAMLALSPERPSATVAHLPFRPRVLGDFEPI